jgi:hypothetical protein
MKRRSRDEEREQRITMEIVVDAYTPKSRPWAGTTPSRTGCGSLGPAGRRRGGRADPPGDRGLALLGRSGLRAVSNADLEGGTAWRLAAPLLGSPLPTGEHLTWIHRAHR